jgi:hypothetical protein
VKLVGQHQMHAQLVQDVVQRPDLRVLHVDPGERVGVLDLARKLVTVERGDRALFGVKTDAEVRGVGVRGLGDLHATCSADWKRLTH